jgi:D-alanyl-D-alanine carboxypeptidase
MSNTRFVNASGLPDKRQLSSARDIAILSRALMRDFPQYYGYFGQKSFVFRGQTIRNHNHLLGSVPGVDGLKTGYINASGFNLAASANRHGRRLIAVVMGGSSVATRDAHMEDLLETGYTVMARRDRGENIQLAQNLFEAAPTGAIVRPPSGQGDDDQRGLQILVDRDLPSTVSPYASTAYRSVPRSTPRFTQIPAPARAMAMVPEPAPVMKKAKDTRPAKPTKAEVKLIKAADVVLCDDDADAAPAKGKKASAKAAKAAKTAKSEKASAKNGKDTRASKPKATKAKATKGKGCDAEPLQVADKGSKKKGKDAKVEKVAARKEEGAWIVQVGAFKDRAAAKAQLAKVSKKVDALADAPGSVHGGVNGMYRARFSGLSKEDARAACASMKAKGMSCLAVNAG